MDRKTGHNCAARGCKNRRYHTGKESFFSLPKDIPRARTWIIACGREDLLQDLENLHSSYRLCGAHFEKNAFQNNLRNRLHKHAVPTIFPAMEGTSTAFDHTYSAFVPITISSSSTPIYQTETESCIQTGIATLTATLVEDETTSDKLLLSPTNGIQTPLLAWTKHSPRKEKMRMIIKQQHNEHNQLLKKNENLEKKANLQRQGLLNNITMEEYANLTYTFCESKEFADFIIVQLKLMQNKPKGRRYWLEFKRDCWPCILQAQKYISRN